MFEIKTEHVLAKEGGLACQVRSSRVYSLLNRQLWEGPDTGTRANFGQNVAVFILVPKQA